jgi:hypothetical protein
MKELFNLPEPTKKDYRVLTLYQPWASLYANGLKLIETRPGPTSFRGTYLIHAAQKWTKEQEEICRQEPFRKALLEIGYNSYLPYTSQPYQSKYNPMPMGIIIGAVDIIDCRQIHNDDFDVFYFNSDSLLINYIEVPELNFGNYAQGRYAWIGKNHRLLKEPIPYKGGQSYYQKFKGDNSKLIFK